MLAARLMCSSPAHHIQTRSIYGVALQPRRCSIQHLLRPCADMGLPLEDEDPTVNLARALGLDPKRLGGQGTGSPTAGGSASGVRAAAHTSVHGVHGIQQVSPTRSTPTPSTPCSAIKALRFALAHPSSTPSLSAGTASGGDHHLAMTASMLAKQRRKAGEGGQPSGGSAASQRVQQIDGLLAAMRRRLRAVQAAMAADLAQVQAAEGQKAGGGQQQLGAIAEEEEAGSPRLVGEGQPAQKGGDEAAVGSQPVPGSQPVLVLSNSGKHTQAHNLLVNVLAGLPAEGSRPPSSGQQHPVSPAVTARSGAGQGSPRLKRPSVVAAELHAFADALREQQ